MKNAQVLQHTPAIKARIELAHKDNSPGNVKYRLEAGLERSIRLRSEAIPTLMKRSKMCEARGNPGTARAWRTTARKLREGIKHTSGELAVLRTRGVDAYSELPG